MGPPYRPLAGWETAGLALPLLRKRLWTLLPLVAALQLAVLTLGGWELSKAMQMAVAVFAWPFIAEREYERWVRGLGGLPAGLRSADAWLRLLTLLYGEVWILGGAILAQLLHAGFSEILQTGGLRVISYCALTGLCYGLLWSLCRRVWPTHPLLAGNVILLLNLIGLLALTYYPDPDVSVQHWPVALARGLSAPYMLTQVDRWWEQTIPLGRSPLYLSQVVYWIEGVVAVTLGMVRLWMSPREE